MSQESGWAPKFRWFAAEFLVVVTGVLVALALNALYQRGENSRSESTYLTLLSRDVRHTITDLEAHTAFEAANFKDGLLAYRVISAKSGTPDYAAASGAMQRLGVRRTLVLQDATYHDLINTGNLRIIRDRALRDKIIELYEMTRARFEILNKNNTFFVDETYYGTVFAQGLILPRYNLSNVPNLAAVGDSIRNAERSGYVDDPDPLWAMARSAPEWAKVKSVLLARIQVAAIGQHMAERLLVDWRQLDAALQTKVR